MVCLSCLALRFVSCNIERLQKIIKSESGCPGFKDLQDVSLNLVFFECQDFCDVEIFSISCNLRFSGDSILTFAP